MLRHAVASGLVMIALAVVPAGADGVPYLQGDVWVWKDIEYGNADGIPLLLDAYLPADKEVHPALVNIHGGGWRNGSKDSFMREGLDYAGNGVAAFSIDYRLSGVATYPAAVDDCWAAVRWIRAHAAELNVDVERMAVQGGSAGGHLALMMAFMEPEEEGLDNYFVCVAAKNPPTDFTAADEMHRENALLAFMGCTWDQDPDRFREASPVTHISPDDPPVFVVHGTEDKTVPYNQALVLQAALEKAGIEHELVTIEGAGHGLRGGDRVAVQNAMRRWRAFVMKHLGVQQGGA
ncbi:MAG: alpha/beta hydrolase [Armatimonadetes bacterium]|nr:alpha/beta hydrolase [Armatimonadota bacterium]